MNCFEINDNQNDKCCKKPFDESIISLKIFDQCRFQECVSQGPVISAEKCTCVILEPDCDDYFGRVVLPNKPIHLPEIAKSVKVVGNSFKTKKIKVTSITPSSFKENHWDIDIAFTFTFKMELFDRYMKKIKILYCPPNCNSLSECKHIKDYIMGSVSYIKTITLFGSEATSAQIASDLFSKNDEITENSPHVLIESKAYFLDAILKSPDEVCTCDEIFDDIYDEPTIYIYITIGLFMIIKLFRLVSLLIESKGYSIAAPCKENDDNDCELFKKIKFPEIDF